MEVWARSIPGCGVLVCVGEVTNAFHQVGVSKGAQRGVLTDTHILGLFLALTTHHIPPGHFGDYTIGFETIVGPQ